jgi:cyclic pyranopterin phosphate synthase
MLVDSYNRVIDYLRISVTDRCSLRCLYCKPYNGVNFLPHEELLRYEEIFRLAKLFVGLGIRKIRITGGEPLERRDILGLIRSLTTLQDLHEVGLTTNGLLLREFTGKLLASGIRRVNVSMDTLNPDRFAELTGKARLPQVIEGITSARKAGLGVKLNIVAMKGINDGEYADFLSFALKHGCDIRFIELMPQMYSEGIATHRYISSSAILESLQKRQRLVKLNRDDRAVKERLYRPKGSQIAIGFISPISDPFCSTCNRLRLLPDGTLKACLYGDGGVNLRDVIRRGGADSELQYIIVELVKHKPDKHRMGCDDANLVMYRTGG